MKKSSHILPEHLRKEFLKSILQVSLIMVTIILGLMLAISPEFPIFIFFPLILVLIGGVWGLKNRRISRGLSHLFVILIWLTVSIYASQAGGSQSPGFYFFLLPPIFAFMILKKSQVYLWLVISIVSFSSFFIFEDYLVFRQFMGNRLWLLISPLLLISTISICLYYFNRFLIVKDQELSEKNQMLERQSGKIDYQAATIHDQFRKIKEQNNFLVEQQQEIETINEQLQELLKDSDRRNEKLEYYIQCLLEASKKEILHSGALEESIAYLCELTGKILKTDRVSIWTFDSKKMTIALLGINIKGEVIANTNSTLSSQDYPSYFDALLKEEMIIANDVMHHPSLKELVHPYLIGQKITSMLDGPFFVDGKLGGVLCCESLNKREWKPEEVIFIKSMTDIISLAFKSKQRKDFEKLLLEQRDLVKKLNTELEKTIDERTKEIMRQNIQLMDYAHLNSHIVRGPICRVLGIKNLLEMTNDPEEILYLKELLLISIKDLDIATQKAAEVLENGISKELVVGSAGLSRN
jgi:hypothetical protein